MKNLLIACLSAAALLTSAAASAQTYPSKPLRWIVDGTPLPAAESWAQTEWKPKSEGFSRVTVIDAEGRSATSNIRLKRDM